MKRYSLTREVLRIAWPMLISELTDSLYSVADTYFVSKVGTIALAAVGVGSYLSWLFFAVVALFSIGVLVYAAQSYGAGAVREARGALGESLIYGTLVASAVSIVMYFIAPQALSIITGPNPELIDVAAKYFRVRILGLPVLAAAIMMDSVVRAVGATKLSMIAMVSSALLNVALDPVLIFGLFGVPQLGVAGAALATVISIIYIIPVELYFLKRLSLTPAPALRPKYVVKVVRVGLPAAAERLVFTVGNNAYIAFISRCGNVALAAHQVGVTLESFTYMPAFAFSIAASVLVGQKIGSGNVDDGKRMGAEAAKIATLLMAVSGVAVALGSRYLVAPFSPNDDVAQLAAIYLVLAGLSEPGLGVAMTLGGAIRGGGNTLVPLFINASGLYLFRVLPAAFLVSVMGVVGAWLAMFVDVYLRGLIFFIVYRKLFERLIRKLV